MVDLISSVDALFSYYGATLFALGLLCALIPRTFRFGVLTLILADIPLALAIAFPRKVIETLNGWGFAPENFPDPQTGHTYGIVYGIATFMVLFALRTLLKSLCAKRKSEQNKGAVGDDDPIELSEDDPSGVSDDKKGLFKGLKGKKSHQSASALHLSSNDNPLNLADTKALKKSEELKDKGDLAHESFSLDPMGATSDDVKEPTLSSDVFTNHMSHDEPHFSNSFIDNAAKGSVNHNYQGKDQGTLELSVMGRQNPITGATEQQVSNWTGLFAKINQAQQQQQSVAASKVQAEQTQQSSQSAKRIDEVELDTFSLAGNKVSAVLEVMDDPELVPELLSKHQEYPKKEESKDNFAQILSSAQEQQSDYASLESDPDYISEEQLAFAALEQSHKTVAQALADLEAQEQEPHLSDKEREDLVSKSHMSSPQVLQDNLQARSLEVVEPSKISYLYSDPVHEDVSETENEPQDDILERYEGDSTNYSFSIKGVFKEKRPLSVAGFIDRASYLEQSQFEANFHEQELEHMVKPDEHMAPQEELKLKRAQILAMARQVAEQMDAELDAKKVQAAAKISADEAQALASLFDDELPKNLSGVTSISSNSGDQYLQSTQTHNSSLDNTEPLELKADLDSEVLLSDREPSVIDSLKLQKSKQDVREANVSKMPPAIDIQEQSHVHNASRSLKLSKVEFLPEPQIAGEIQSAATSEKSVSQTAQSLVSKKAKLPSSQNKEKLSIGRALFNKLRPNKVATTESTAAHTKSAPAPSLQGENKLSTPSSKDKTVAPQKTATTTTESTEAHTKSASALSLKGEGKLSTPSSKDKPVALQKTATTIESKGAPNKTVPASAITQRAANNSNSHESNSKKKKESSILKSSKEQMSQVDSKRSAKATTTTTSNSADNNSEVSQHTTVAPKSKILKSNLAINNSTEAKESTLSKITKEQLSQVDSKSAAKATTTIEGTISETSKSTNLKIADKLKSSITTTHKAKRGNTNKVNTTNSAVLSIDTNSNSEVKRAGALQTKSKMLTVPKLSTISEIAEAPKATLKHKRRISKKVADDDVLVKPSIQELNRALAKDAALEAFSSLADVDELESLVKDSCAVQISAFKSERKSASLKKSLRRTKR